MTAATLTPAQARGRAAPRAARREPEAPHGLAFALFLLVNAVLFVRPSDVFPALEGIELYQYAILACLAVGFPAILEHLQPARLERRPVDLCVLGLLPAVVLSHLLGGRAEQMLDDTFFFFKIVVYYLLFVSLVTTPARLRTFCTCLILYACAVAILSALDFHKVIRIPRGVNKWGWLAFQDETRMYGPGIFQDPNDVCVLIACAVILLLGRLAEVKAGVLRWGWLIPLAVFAYGLYLTRSRGGMMALMAGLGVVAGLKWGWRQAILVAVFLAPVGLAGVLATREVNLNSQHDTGQARIQLWNEGLVMYRANPLFGVGMNCYHQHAGQVAHNSYIQAFGELGILGGTLFLGAAILSIGRLLALARPVLGPGGRLIPTRFLDEEMSAQYPFLVGCIVAYACGMLTLSMNYLVVTYTFFGMASMMMGATRTVPERPTPPSGAGLWVTLVLLGQAFLLGVFVFVRLTFRP